jgi:hypothetical protein
MGDGGWRRIVVRRQCEVKVTRRLHDPSFIRVWCPRIVLVRTSRMTPVVARLGLGAGSRVGWVRVGYWAGSGFTGWLGRGGLLGWRGGRLSRQ